MYYDVLRRTNMYYDVLRLHYNVLQTPLLNTKHLSCIHTLTRAHLLHSTSHLGAMTKAFTPPNFNNNSNNYHYYYYY